MTVTNRSRRSEWGTRSGHFWVATFTVGFLGVLATGLGWHVPGLWLYSLAVVLLAAVATRRVGALSRAASAVPTLVGLVLFLVALFLPWALEGEPYGHVAMRMFASQFLLLGLTIENVHPRHDWGRAMIPISGHLAAATAAVIIGASPGGIPAAALLLAMVGFALLLLEAFWAHNEGGRSLELTRWESVFMGVLIVGLFVVALLAFLSQRLFVFEDVVVGASLALIRSSVLFGVAVLVGPPADPGRLKTRPGSLVEMMARAGLFLGVVYGVFLVLALSALWFVGVVFWLLLAWLLSAVLLEYAAVAYHVSGRRGGSEEALEGVEDVRVTAVMAVRNDAEVIRKSVPANLAQEAGLGFLLVPAAGSTDGTVEAARALEEAYPERVRVEVGHGGSKAADLNQAWPLVETDVVLVLDADEVLDEGALARGLARLRGDASIGVVQGRKKGRGEPVGWLDRFIRAERRFSTLLDHPMQDGLFGAAHFAGAGALLRWEVPQAVGGWDAVMLTEDIDFALRLRRETDWRIVYEEAMIVWETEPLDLGSFLRQRGRWARGWSQVAARHLPGLLVGRERVGARERFGWAWQAGTAVSAPWAVFLPFLGILWLIGDVPALVGLATFVLGVIILPSRAISYLYAYYAEPHGQQPRGLKDGLRVFVLAYLWIVAGWILQLQALYLEASSAPRVWEATRGTDAQPEGSDPPTE